MLQTWQTALFLWIVVEMAIRSEVYIIRACEILVTLEPKWVRMMMRQLRFSGHTFQDVDCAICAPPGIPAWWLQAGGRW